MGIQIGRVVIERRHGPEWCGLLFYEEDGRERILPWSVASPSDRQLVLKLFPSNRDGHLDAVQEHYQVLADAIVAEVRPSS